MPQGSIAYAVARVRTAARKPLGDSQLERLLSAPGYEDALRALGEMGWSGVESGNIEALSVSMLEKACARIREITPDPALTDAFLMRHDAQNLKALLKERILDAGAEALSNCGTIPVEVLRHAVAERVYRKLPEEFRLAMEALEKRVSLGADPMEIDVRIDQALYGLIQKNVKHARSQAVKQYFAGFADLRNVVSFLRLRAMEGAGVSFLDLLLPGGAISRDNWVKLADQPEGISRRLAPYGKAVQAALKKALQEPKAVPALEKAADDWLLGLFRPYRSEPFAVEVLVGWLLAHERETTAVRLILSGKLNGFPVETIRERLRDAYGR